MSFENYDKIDWEEMIKLFDEADEVIKHDENSHTFDLGLADLNQICDEIDEEEKNEDNQRKTRILTGLHGGSFDIPMATMTITKTKKVKEIVYKKEIVREPPQKKQKTTSSDWRNGHNKALNEDNQNDKAVSKISNKANKNKKQNDADFFIPIGCESLFNAETCSLVEELQDLDPSFVARIGSELLETTDNISFAHIAGLKKQKKKIKQIVIWPLKRPDLFDKTNGKLRKPPKGLLLFGPPGTGKTLIAKAIAAEADCRFFTVSSSSLTSRWVGESSKLVKTMFRIARFMAPSIIFIDEIDSILSKRGDSSAGKDHLLRMKNEFLTEFEGVKSSVNDGHVLIVGATNFPENIDDAARRRLNKRILIPLQGKEGRKEMFMKLLKHEKHCLDEKEIDELVQKTEGYSGSDIQQVAEEASVGPLEYVNIETVKKDDVRPIAMKDFLKALDSNKASVSSEQCEKYERWNAKFGADLSNLKTDEDIDMDENCNDNNDSGLDQQL